MNIDSLLQPFQHFGVNLGLDRINRLLANLGNPHHLVPVIHIAGTNGKGSVCAYLSSILTEAGYRTGRYTSPHLVNWTERICLNEEQISAEEFYKFLLEVKAAVNSDELPTLFEITTAAAWLYFAQQKVDVAVVEVGLGGRLDATNVISEPLVTVITSISREHWQQLGDTVAEIAGEKAGILKPGCPVVMGILPPDAEQVVRSRAQELKCPLITPQPAHAIHPGWAEYQSINQAQRIQYPLPLQGQIQLTNSAVALATLEILSRKGWRISESAMITGMAKAKWPGRMQWITWNNHKLLIDGAHNPAAAKVLRDYVDTLNYKNITWVMGMLSTKDHAEIFQALLKSNDQLYLVPVLDNNSANPQELATIAAEICPELNLCQIDSDLISSLTTAVSAADNLVVLCGSLYLIGHFLELCKVH